MSTTSHMPAPRRAPGAVRLLKPDLPTFSARPGSARIRLWKRKPIYKDHTIRLGGVEVNGAVEPATSRAPSSGRRI